MESSLPAEWHEVESPDHITGKYRAKTPILFVREDHEVGVHVLPAATSSPHDEEFYRVGAIRGNRDEFEYEREIGEYDERERALQRAFDFARRYDDVYEEEHDEERALETAVDRVS
ncbi:MAG: hypothetical protein ABEJ68_05840 [Halobacteriaceae archaeon]